MLAAAVGAATHGPTALNTEPLRVLAQPIRRAPAAGTAR